MLNLHFVAQMSVERLLNGLGEGVLIALFAWVLLRIIGRRNAGTRFAVWFCALGAIVLAPFLETTSATGIVHPAAAIVMPREWSWYLFAAWTAIALVGMARVVAGLRHLHVIRKSCVPVETSTLDSAILQAMQEFRSVRGVELCASDAVQIPTAIGFFRPAVVLPSWTLRELSTAELHALVLHELAHLRRWDDWTNLAQKILRALFFFHPAVWWVERRLSLEREMACDDMVLAHTANPRAYAECLVSLAEKNFLRRGLALAQAAVGRMRQTSLRVLQILDARRPNGVRIWKPAPWVVAGFSVVCLGVAARAPKLVAFRDASTFPVSLTASANLRDEASSYSPPVLPASYIAPANGLQNNRVKKETATHSGVRSRPSVKQTSLKTKASFRPMVPRVHQAKSSAGDKTPSVQLVRASVSESSPRMVIQQAVFVFEFTTESQRHREDHNEFSGASFPLYFSGEQSLPVIWQVRIWRLTVFSQRPAQQVEVPSKSI
jgi:Zn-dependent protease with chaperone function